MDSDRIKELHKQTAYPESISVYKALLQVWNECQQEHNEQLRIGSVSNQRELLIRFSRYLKQRDLILVRSENLAVRVKLFLESN